MDARKAYVHKVERFLCVNKHACVVSVCCVCMYIYIYICSFTLQV